MFGIIIITLSSEYKLPTCDIFFKQINIISCYIIMTCNLIVSYRSFFWFSIGLHNIQSTYFQNVKVLSFHIITCKDVWIAICRYPNFSAIVVKGHHKRVLVQNFNSRIIQLLKKYVVQMIIWIFKNSFISKFIIIPIDDI